MIRHFLKTIFKSLKKSGKITLFNLIGLSVSFAAFILLSIFLWSEFTFDHYHKKVDDLYMLQLNYEIDGQTESSFHLPNPMADAILQGIPEMDNLCSFAWGAFNYSTEEFGESNVEIWTRAVDSSFVDMFSLEIIKGTNAPLKNKGGIILSETAAKRMFGNENPVGKTIWSNYQYPYSVEAVFKDLPANVSMRYDAYCSYPTADWVNNWSEYSFLHVFKIPNGVNVKEIGQQILTLPEMKVLEEDEGVKYSFALVPYADLHFHKGFGNGNLTFVRILVIVSLLLILMAFTNYLNFAFASAPKVLRSVNMRRVVGESRLQQRILFILEAIILVVFAFSIALGLAFAVLKIWPDLFAYDIKLNEHITLEAFCLIGFILLAIICAWIPARLITNVQPAIALKGQVKFLPKRRLTGNILTMFQYAISIMLIIGVLFIQKQVKYMQNYDPGFDKENILVITLTPSVLQQENAFTEEIINNPEVIDYAYSQFVPGGVEMGWGRNIDGKYVNFKCWPVDERYLNLMGIEIIEGRGFSENIEADEDNFIFNQKALLDFGWTEDYLGKTIPGFDFSGQLVGVAKDINFASLHGEIEPMAFWLTKGRHNRISIKITDKNVNQTIQYFKEVYEKFETKYPFDYNFLDKTLDAQYKSDQKQGRLILIFSIISIMISIVGVLGIIIFMSEYRIKEVGVRKVNGASNLQIMFLLNKDVLFSVLIAYIIAVPISYFAIKDWMSGFAYQTNMSWWIFILAGISCFLIAIITISWQSWKAATRNPVESLRYE